MLNISGNNQQVDVEMLRHQRAGCFHYETVFHIANTSIGNPKIKLDSYKFMDFFQDFGNMPNTVIELGISAVFC
jgi:hypothetical protein